MIKKRTKKTGKKTAKAAPKRRSTRGKKKDIAQVRHEIAEIVKDNANKMTEAMVTQVIGGQATQAKYLFEVAKIFPEVEGEEATQEEDSLVKILLSKLQPPRKTEEDGREDGGEDTDGGAAAGTGELKDPQAPSEDVPAAQEQTATAVV